jgi:predicted DNA-binding transcriptional regulator YafY
MTNPSSVSRVLALMQLLANPGSGQIVKHLAEHFQTSEKTIRRDIEELRSHGIRVLEQSGANNRKSYSIEREELPPIRLTFDEALAIFLGKASMIAFSQTGLEQAATRAFLKLRSTLGETESKYVDKLVSRIHFTKWDSAETKESGVVDDLLVAIEDSRAIFIEYLSANSTEPLTYDIYPFGLAEHKSSLYIVGFSCHHSEIRTWKVDRVRSTELTRFPFKRPADFDIAKYFEGAFAIVGGNTQQMVRVRFAARVARYVCEKRFHPSQLIEKQSDGGVVLQFGLTSLLEIRSWILSFGALAEVLEPLELRTSLRQEAEQLARIYEMKQTSTSSPFEARQGN